MQTTRPGTQVPDDHDHKADTRRSLAGPGQTASAPPASRFFVSTPDLLADRVEAGAQAGRVYSTPLLPSPASKGDKAAPGPGADAPILAATDAEEAVLLTALQRELRELPLAELQRRSAATTAQLQATMQQLSRALGTGAVFCCLCLCLCLCLGLGH